MKVQERENKQNKLKEINNDLAMIKSGIEIPENSIKNGKSDLEALLTKDTLDRDPIARAHQKISMGMKRRSELRSLFKRHKKRDKN